MKDGEGWIIYLISFPFYGVFFYKIEIDKYYWKIHSKKYNDILHKISISISTIEENKEF